MFMQRIKCGSALLLLLATISAGMPSQADLYGDPVITIGDRCSLGKGIGIVGHERIEIGDDIWTGHYVYVTDPQGEATLLQLEHLYDRDSSIVGE